MTLVTQPNPPLTGSFAVVGDSVHQHLDEFARHGFKLSSVVWRGSDKLGRYPIFKFLNQRTGMAMRISFFPAQNGLNGGFVTMILKPVNHRLDVEDYLKMHAKSELTRFFTYRDPNADLRVFAHAFLQMLDGLMAKELMPVLEGKVWEDTPVDWQGYK
jgi:hypothetical protein